MYLGAISLAGWTASVRRPIGVLARPSHRLGDGQSTQLRPGNEVTPSLRLPQDAGPLHGLSKPAEQVLLALAVSEFYEQANSLLRS